MTKIKDWDIKKSSFWSEMNILDSSVLYVTHISFIDFQQRQVFCLGNRLLSKVSMLSFFKCSSGTLLNIISGMISLCSSYTWIQSISNAKDVHIVQIKGLCSRIPVYRVWPWSWYSTLAILARQCWNLPGSKKSSSRFREQMIHVPFFSWYQYKSMAQWLRRVAVRREAAWVRILLGAELFCSPSHFCMACTAGWRARFYITPI